MYPIDVTLSGTLPQSRHTLYTLHSLGRYPEPLHPIDESLHHQTLHFLVRYPRAVTPPYVTSSSMLPQRRHTTRRYIFWYVTPEPLHLIVVTSSGTLPQSRHITRRCIVKVKVKMQVFYSLISSLKTYHRT